MRLKHTEYDVDDKHIKNTCGIEHAKSRDSEVRIKNTSKEERATNTGEKETRLGHGLERITSMWTRRDMPEAPNQQQCRSWLPKRAFHDGSEPRARRGTQAGVFAVSMRPAPYNTRNLKGRWRQKEKGPRKGGDGGPGGGMVGAGKTFSWVEPSDTRPRCHCQRRVPQR
ncbi:hypothetical protein NDU88_000970 [Pleurodeles waltl]|uniref:Uncharacterized protein n=1 Tax=Pleurodeles waltl TaxID=8319 RepID=A0AAV7P5R2_PLEWA|nr:hypothetical protein NDU88_000970 [Pleurodeles waltl]